MADSPLSNEEEDTEELQTEIVQHNWSKMYDTAVVCENPQLGGHSLCT
jgi:hypothetical protein